MNDKTASEPDLKTIYGDPSVLRPLGAASAGMALADIDRDGWRDLVLANGIDLSPQALVVYCHRGTPSAGVFAGHPSWYSADIDHHGGLAVGDLNGDGWLDLAVAVPFDHLRRPHSGSVKVYLNDGKGSLQGASAYAVGVGFQALDVALGDVDGDGRLDLAVAGVDAYDPSTKVALAPAQQRIHLNRRGRLSAAPTWTTQDPMAAASVRFADVNQDGRLDLVLGSRRIGVYYGRSSPPATVPLARVPDWQSDATHTAIYGLDVGRMSPGDATLSLVAGDNCRTRKCDDSKFYVYRPSDGSSARWSMPADNASKVLFIDANGDERLDLVAAQLGAGEHGAELLFVPGSSAVFATDGMARSSARFLGISVSTADLRHVGSTSSTLETTPSGAIVTLPHRQIESVESVAVDGKQLARKDWSWVPGRDWLSLGPAARAGSRATIRYQWSTSADVVVSGAHGFGAETAIFLSKYETNQGRATTPPETSAKTVQDR